VKIDFHFALQHQLLTRFPTKHRLQNLQRADYQMVISSGGLRFVETLCKIFGGPLSTWSTQKSSIPFYAKMLTVTYFVWTCASVY